MAEQIVLLGDPVDHSLSPTFQNAGLRAIGSPTTYALRRVDVDGMRAAAEAVRAGAIGGANVTVPHKAVAARMADETSDAVSVTGAANTWVGRDGCLIAENTDVVGIAASLDLLEWSAESGPALVLGAGGASASVLAALSDCGASALVVNRDLERAAELAARFSDRMEIRTTAWPGGEGAAAPLLAAALAESTLVVQATSAQLGASGGASSVFGALPWSAACPDVCLLDLTYSRRPTSFLTRGPASARRLDGAAMLLHQGAASFALWTGVRAPIRAMADALAAALGRDAKSLYRPAGGGSDESESG